MKRSEMINIIASCLYGDLNNLSQEEIEGISKVVLSHVEGAGMLPPYNKNHGVSSYDIAMGCSDELMYNWEPEDEN